MQLFARRKRQFKLFLSLPFLSVWKILPPPVTFCAPPAYRISMKIYVYAIAKNESAFVSRWMSWAKSSDGVFVLDTGSVDGTAEKLEQLGAVVTREVISPWRFDEARNRSLSLVPEDADVCVCADLDEVFDDGWREAITSAFEGGINLCRVRYVWSTLENGKEGVVFHVRKMHARQGFYWKGVVHETLEPQLGTAVKEGVISNVSMRHYPDKTKSRAQYLPLLEQAVKEDALNDRNAHYLGREYMYYGRLDEAITALKNHLALPTATWAEERCASMRYIARCYSSKNDKERAFCWFLRAVAEYPYSREPFVELGSFAYSVGDYDCAVWALTKALEIPAPSPSYINDPVCFSALPHDVLSIALYKTGRVDLALNQARLALSLAPNDKRIAYNVDFFQKESARISFS